MRPHDHAPSGVSSALLWLGDQEAQNALPTFAKLSIYAAFWAARWRARARTRRALSTLEPWQLNDVGLSPDQARREAEKAFWRG